MARKRDLVGELNKGWTVGKRLLQFERSGIGGLPAAHARATGRALVRAAKNYMGEDRRQNCRHRRAPEVTTLNMNRAAFQLTAQRANEENKSGIPGAATSIFKLYGAALQQDGAALKRELMGFRAWALESARLHRDELEPPRNGWHQGHHHLRRQQRNPGQHHLPSACSACRNRARGEQGITHGAVQSFQTIGVDSITPHIGAEIDGVDLSKPLSNEQFRRYIRPGWTGRWWCSATSTSTATNTRRSPAASASLHVHPMQHSYGGDPEVLTVKTTKDSAYTAGNGWHTDVTCDEIPPLGSMLYMKETPEGGGGDTLFADMYLAYELLSDTMKDAVRED